MMKWFMAVTLTLAACSDGSSRFQYESEGRLCVLAGSPPLAVEDMPQDFAADQPVTLDVMINSCVSGCAQDIEASCEIAVTGNALQVTSRGSYTEGTSSGIGCPDVCNFLRATCTTPPLAAGIYTVAHGGESVTLTIPSTTPSAPCVGEEAPF